MPLAHLQNVCAETAIKFAIEKVLPHISVLFNFNKNAHNDFQIPLFFIYKNIPGQNTQLTQLQDKNAFEELLRSTLSKNKVYCVRTGQNDGAGHYSFLRYEEEKWRLSTGPSKDIALTDAEGNFSQNIFEQEFRRLNAQKCGTGNGQYSIQINELNTARAICAMNYIAVFRQKNEVEGVDFAEMMTNGAFDDLIKVEDVFLHLTQDARDYWQLSNALAFSLAIELDERKRVYTFQLLEHDNAEFLAKLLTLDDFNINTQDEFGRTLLHRSVQNKSTNAVRVLLEQGINHEIKDHSHKTAQDYLREMAAISNSEELLPLQSCFELIAIRRAIANPAEHRNLLIVACSQNNAKGIELLISAVNLSSQDYVTSLSALLQAKEYFSFSWNTIEESLFWLLDKLFEVDENATQHALNMLFTKGFDSNYRVYAQGELHNKTLSQLAQVHGRKGIADLLRNGIDNSSASQIDETSSADNGFFLRGERIREDEQNEDKLIQELKERYTIFACQASIEDNDRIDVAQATEALNQVFSHYDAQIMHVKTRNRLTETLHILLKNSLDDSDVSAQIRPALQARYEAYFPVKHTKNDPESICAPADLQQNKLLVTPRARQEAITLLNNLLDNYLQDRQEGKDQPREKYFWGGFFGGGFTYKQKEAAVQALKKALAGDEVDLEAHLNVLRDGTLGATLRQFIRTPFPKYEIRLQAHCIVGSELSGNRVRDFIRDLAAYTRANSNKQDNRIIL